jgi:hypothetical protein
MSRIWPAGGKWPYLSFRDPLGYGGVKTNHPIEQIIQRWANAVAISVSFINIGSLRNIGNPNKYKKWLPSWKAPTWP